jgi:hypothetical protein
MESANSALGNVLPVGRHAKISLATKSSRFPKPVLDCLRMHLSWPDFAEKEQ